MTMTKAELAAHKAARIRTQRVRAMAARQGYRLEKIRRVDKLALDYGCFDLYDGEQKVNDCGRSLESIEEYLLSGPRLAKSERKKRRGK